MSAPGTGTRRMIVTQESAMEREANNLVELGTVTSDTAGDHGLPFEPAGRMLVAGIEQD